MTQLELWPVFYGSMSQQPKVATVAARMISEAGSLTITLVSGRY